MKKTSTMHSSANRGLRKLVILVSFIVSIIIPIQNLQAQGSYYVGGSGASDSNPGTSTQPFATIQKAATVAAAGSFVNIRPGTYRETITPTNSGSGGSPITFQSDGGIVIVSGTNTADGDWTVHSGSIYQKTITLPLEGFAPTITSNTTLLANQIFKDGEMMFQARWPDIGTQDDLLDNTKLRPVASTSSFTETSLTDNGLPQVAGGLAGGKIWINGWFISQTRTINSQAGSTLNYDASLNGDKFRKYYYVTGKLGLLDVQKEWHYENNTLYFWQPGGGAPTGVEYKARNYGFDLTNRSNITIKNIQFFACVPVQGNASSTNTTIDGIVARYMNHSFMQEGGNLNYDVPKQCGIKLIGANSIIKNSDIQYTSSEGIWLGANCTAENNLIRDISYEGNYGAAITPWDNDGGQTITKNTIYRTGRAAIDFGFNENAQHQNMEISFNDIYHFGMLNIDLGGIYAWGNKNLTGTRIHHNWVHDTKVANATSVDGIQTGVYLDQHSGPITMDHNVFWNNGVADFYNQIGTAVSNIYNNTFASVNPVPHSYVTYTTTPSDVQRNNIYRKDIVINWGAGPGDIDFALLEGVDPLFIGGGTGGLAYRLQASSPAINSGTAIPGITNGSVGVPDKGAYEFGGTDWVPGYSSVGGIVEKPVANPAAGTYTSAQSVTITTATPGAFIRYTTDGNAPTDSSTIYSGPIDISTNTTLMSIGFKDGMISSATDTAIYIISTEGITTINDSTIGTGQNQFEFVGGGWGSGANSGAYLNDEHYSGVTDDYYQVDFTGTQIEVYSQKYNSSGIAAYSIDGGPETLIDHYNPTLLLNTLVYTSPALADSSHTLKVRVTGTKNASSSFYWLVADRVVITAGPKIVATPAFSPAAGTYTSAQSVTISTATPGAEIRYTIDGSKPTGSSILYTGPVSISTTTTLKAIGIKLGLTNSVVAKAIYKMQVATPEFNPVAGTYTTTQSVTITTTTPGAEIRYTTDGSKPTASSALYTGPVSIPITTTLKAVGFKAGMINSEVAKAIYTISASGATTTINNTVIGTGQNQFEYVGTGWGSGPSTGAYLNDEHYSGTTGDYYQIDFTGSRIKVYAQKFNSQGIAAYSIDGGPETFVDHYNPTLSLNTLVYTSPILSNGSHTLKVRVTGTKNTSSSYYWLVADRVVISSVNMRGGGTENVSTGSTAEIKASQNAGKYIVYPNPGNGRFFIKSNYTISTVEIFNASGGRVHSLKNQSGIKEIDISRFSDGIYFIKLFDGKNYFTEKVIKN